MRHAPRVVVGVVAAAIVAGLAAGFLLRVRPGYVDLLDAQSPVQRRYLQLLDELGNVEPLHVVVESADPATAAAVVDDLAPRLLELADPVFGPLTTSVVDRVDTSALADRAAAWLPAAAARALAEIPRLPELVADPHAASILDLIRAALERARDAGLAGDSPAAGDAPSPAGLASIVDSLASIARGDEEPLARNVLRSLSRRGREGLDADGRLELSPGRLLLTVMPRDSSADYRVMAVLVNRVRAEADAAIARAGGNARVSLTGAPALIADEMTAVRRDIALASSLSFLLVTLLFFVSFNSLRHVLFAAVANACGLALTFGAAWFLVGYLNLFSSVFAAVLAGLGIDFGIHFINFYEARRRNGLAAEPALVSSFASVFPPIALSAVTTAAAFLMVMTSQFAGFSQLGLISGVGVLLCLLTAFTLIPGLLAWEARRRPRHPAGARPPWSLPLLLLPVRGARVVAPLGLALVALAMFGALRLRFDHDLMRLQPEGTEALALQVDESRRVATHPAIMLAENAAAARALAERLRRLPNVASVMTPADALPPEDPERGPALLALHARLTGVAGDAPGDAGPAPPDASTPLARARASAAGLRTDLIALQDLAFEGGSATAVTALDAPIAAAERLEQALLAPGAGERLAALRDDLAPRLARMVELLPALAAHGIVAADLPAALRSMVGRHGAMAVVAMPRESVWDRAAVVNFVESVRAVAPEVTGPAVQVAEITELMRTSLLNASALAVLVIITFVFVTTRRVRTTLLSLLPLTCGFVLMLGLMTLTGVPLNPANLVALPLLLGIGVDGGVHLIHRWEEVGDAATAITDVGHALLITSLTTVAGFLPLLLAKHRGIRSLGAATCLGSLGMLLAVVVIAPAFLAVLDRARAARSAP